MKINQFKVINYFRNHVIISPSVFLKLLRGGFGCKAVKQKGKR